MPSKQASPGVKKTSANTTTAIKQGQGLFVVGIGASAGGLDAINMFFENTKHDSAAYIVVQHISSEYKSLIRELISRHTRLSVLEASEGLQIKPNYVYVIPAKKYLTIANGTLHLDEKIESRGSNTAIDRMLISLAKDFKKKAIAIILSGAGSDGSDGVEAVKKAGGLVIVQDPSTAMFDGMPNSAIKTGKADFVIPPDSMAEEINNFIKNPSSIKFYNENISHKEEGILSDILILVRDSTGRDFTQYKRPTIIRRLKRRMMQQGYEDFESYKESLKKNETEIKALCKEFLISVTRFFRDPSSFEDLAKIVVPEIVNNKKKNEPVKIWVVGCSTGEEAYSIAIVLREFLNKIHSVTEVKIFATDIDQAAIETAGKGIYDEEIKEDVSEERLSQFFEKNGKKYKVAPTIRKMVIFTIHDALSDPPFGKIDLLSCRNLLIYLSTDLQKRLLSMFLFSLTPGGYLFLGNSENRGEFKNSMRDISAKSKIFQKSDSAQSVWMPPYRLGDRSFIGEIAHLPVKDNLKSDYSGFLSDTLLEEFGIVSVYVDENFEILQAYGDFRKYLSLPDRLTGFNILKMVPDSLSIALGNGIGKVFKTNSALTIKGIHLSEKSSKAVNIFLKPVDSEKFSRKSILIFFTQEELVNIPEENPEIFDKEVHISRRVHVLENELKETKASLQYVIEQLETSNEELQSANEELLSANEELQSTNEELQSLNEELYTVNNEHTLKIQELEVLNDDMNNYFKASHIGQIFVDRDLKIRKYTPEATNIINLTESDIERPINHFSHNIKDIDLSTEIGKVISNPGEIIKEVQSQNGRWYQMKIIPYMRLDNRLDGAVITFFDITQMRILNEMVSGITENSPSGIIALGSIREDEKISGFRLLSSNPKAEEILGIPLGFVKNKILPKNIPLLGDKLMSICTRVIESLENEHQDQVYKSPKGTKWLSMGIARFGDGVVINIEDITDRKKLEKEKEKYFEELKLKNTELQHWAFIAENNLRDPLRTIKSFGGLLKTKAELHVDNETKEFIGYMVSGALEMESMILSLLDYSEIDGSKKPSQRLESDRLIEFATNAIKDIIKKSKAKISIDTTMPEIKGVISYLTMVFQQLIENAIKFTEDGMTPDIHIGCEAKDNFWQFYVKDNGMGFDGKNQERIFRIFQQLNKKDKYAGTGIGLAICKKIIEKHGGKIWAESNPGNGTVFYFTLPKQRRDASP